MRSRYALASLQDALEASPVTLRPSCLERLEYGLQLVSVDLAQVALVADTA
jgi:hypothetical protein